MNKQKEIVDHIHLSKEKLRRKDTRYFYDNLSSREQWRIFKEYQDATACIDIETTGLGGGVMLRYMGWAEAADLIVKGLGKTILNETVTYDFARLMDGAKKLKCSEFATEIIKNML